MKAGDVGSNPIGSKKMIRKVKEVHVGTKPHGDGWVFWTYLICVVNSGRRGCGYNLIRIDNVCDKMEVLGRELTLGHCRSLIIKAEMSDVAE